MSAEQHGHGESLPTTIIAFVAVLTFCVWSGAGLAGIFFGAGWPTGGIPAAFQALLRLPTHLTNPAAAWSASNQARLPAPLPYWTCTASSSLAIVALATLLYRFRSTAVGTKRRRRLGVDTRARLARSNDLSSMHVKMPAPGRLILGRVGGRYVATEDRRNSPARSRSGRRRQGDRSSVAIFGPTRSGKTASTISGILEWSGPAILSSVKSDLLAATLEHRSSVGEVRIFDPVDSLRSPTLKTSQWSPLREANTVTGAQKAARTLAESGPKGGADNLDFFSSMAETLLWPLLFTATVTNRSMSDVARWVLQQDRPTSENEPGEVALSLQDLVQSQNACDQANARSAVTALTSIWTLDDRTRSSTYATCATMIQPWQDPTVCASTAQCEIDLDWLVSGNNTLYICAPMNDQHRLAPLFGGLLGDLFNQAYARCGETNEPLPSTLVVMDEAGNTPTRWLPQVASTCSGLGILLLTIWQSKAQMDASYGRLSDSVWTNHGTKIIYSGVSDASTLNYVSTLVGDEEVHTVSASINASGIRQGSNESTTRSRLISSDLLRQVAPFEGLLIHGTLPPAHLVGRPYWKDARLAALAGIPKKRHPFMPHFFRKTDNRPGGQHQ